MVYRLQQKAFSGHILVVEECSKNELDHLRIGWLPQNCTSICQLVDQGVAQTIKLRYEELLNEHMARMIDLNKDPIKTVDVPRSCIWLGRAWKSK